MIYRILFMMSGLLMMFSVYAYVMMVGALAGDNDAWFGNVVLGSVFAMLTLIVFRIAKVKQKRAHLVFESAISELIASTGYVDAREFSIRVGTSVDDARDVLDKLVRSRNWRREEGAQYNARYYPIC